MDVQQFRDRIESLVFPIKPNRNRALLRFRYWNVETLLNRASDLLDRCLDARATLKVLDAQNEARHWEQQKIEAAVALDIKRVESDFVNQSYKSSERRLQMLESLTAKYSGIDTATRYLYDNSPQGLEQWRALLEQNRASISNAIWRAEKIDASIDARHKKEEGERQALWIEAQKQFADDAKRGWERPDDHYGNNYSIQSLMLRLRIARDYKEASDYLLAAQEGLLKVFDKAWDGSGPVLPASDLWTVVENLDVSVDWVRSATQWLNGFTLVDQAVAEVVPLRKFFNEESWEGFRRADSLARNFFLPGLFRGLKYVRFRGLSATSISSGNPGLPMRCEIHLPASAAYHQGEQIYRPIDQSSLPNCILGNVWDYRLPRSCEVAGATSLVNASPVSLNDGSPSCMWALSVSAAHPSITFPELQDILLEIRGVGHQISNDYGRSSEIRDV